MTAFQPPPASLLVLYKAHLQGPYFMPFLLIAFLRKINLPSQSYADDLKFVADVSVLSKEVVHSHISIVAC